MSDFTGYGMSKVVNEEFTRNGFKVIPPQMIYTYIKKGMIESIEVNGQKRVTKEVCDQWIQTQLEKKFQNLLKKEIEENESQLEEDGVVDGPIDEIEEYFVLTDSDTE